MKRMKKTIFTLVLSVLFGTTAVAATANFRGKTVTYTGGATAIDSATGSAVSDGGTVSGELILKFTSDGTLVLPAEAKARFLAVGGGGGGGHGGYASGGSASGGEAGKTVENAYLTLPADTYTADIGAGGAGGERAGKYIYDSQEGKDGESTHFNASNSGTTGFANITAKYGAKGVAKGKSDGESHRVDSDIAGGGSKPYAIGGAGSSSSVIDGDANTGNGGSGGKTSGKAFNHGVDGGDGGSGIVVVRLLDFVSKESKSSSVAMLPNKGTKDVQLASGNAFSESVQWDSTVTSGNSSIATATMVDGTTATTQPTMRITPGGTPGTTTLTVKNSSNTDLCVFTWTVTVTVEDVASRTANLTIGKGSAQQTVTCDKLCSEIATSWSQKSYSGSGAATISLVNSSSTRTPSATVKPVEAGRATFVAQNGNDAYTWTINVKVTDAQTKNINMLVGASESFTLAMPVGDDTGAGWTVSGVPSGLTLNKTSGTGTSAALTVTANKTGSGSFTVSNGYMTWTVNVNVRGEVVFKGQTITYGGTDVECSGGGTEPVVLTYTTTGESADFVIPAGLEALADYLVIGGGGSGGSGRNYNNANYPRYGGGGSGGRGEEGFLVPFSANTYSISVGKGGDSVSGTTSDPASGKNGNPSSISASGFTTITAAGGAGGITGTAAPSSQTDGNITESSITGSQKPYAQRGQSSGYTASTGNPGTPSTGNGGNGGGLGGASGAGGSGIVIVKIRDIGAPHTSVNGGELTLGVDDELTLRDDSFASAWMAVSADPSIATVTGEGAAEAAPVITGKKVGMTTVKVYNETEVWTYTVSVVQNLTDVYLCVGDTVKFGFRSDAATATWTTTLNNVPFTSTDATAGAYTTVKRSTAGASQAFDVLITATAASGELTDMLYVKGSSANDPVYVYRIHVAPTREMTIGDVARNVCNSCSSRAWTASSAQPAIATVSPTSASAADGFEATITAVRNGETTLTVADAITALVNNQEVGATYTLKVKVDGPVPVNVSLARGSTVKWTDVYSKGVAGTAYALDKSAESGVSAMTEKTGDKTALTTLTAADDAVVGATVTFTVKAGDDTVTVYTVMVTDILRIPNNETLQNVASDARARWGIVQTSASASVAALAASGVPSAGNANITLTPEHPGEATMFATNDWATGTQAYGWNVRVYSTHSTSLALNVNDQGNVTMRNFGDLTGSWSAQIGNPDAASLAFDIASAGGEAVNAAMLTVSSAKTLPLNVDELVTTVTASNAYHEESILLTVKKQARNQGSRTVVSGNNLVIGGAEVAAPWNATASPAGIVQLSAESGEAGEALTVSSIRGKSGTVEVKVRTATTVFTYTMRVVPEPYVVKFCEGDSVRIWYHNTEPKNWFLLVNDEVVQGNREWNGREVRAKVTMEGAPNRDSYLDAWAERPGAEADGDMIVVSDGENYYAYLMSCATERVIGVGQSTNMVCSTVATNIWRSSVPTEYSPYVEVRNSPNDERVHSTTATITGVAATDVAYVDVSDQVFDAAEVNAQGAIYRLKVRVEGTPTISVNLTPLGYLEAPQDYRYGTAASDFKIFVNDSDTPLEGTSATANGLTFTMERVSGNLLNVRFEAAADAASTATAKFVVRDVAKVGGDNTVAVYNVAIAGPVRAIPTGTVIEGVLNPAPLQWIAEVADPDVASIKPKQYGELWSVEATAKKPGDFYCQSRNPMISQGYWGSLTYVYDTHATETNLARSMTYEFDVANAGDLAGVWSASASSDLVTVTLSDGENALNSVHVTITTKAVQGATTVKISNIYHVETFNIYVGGTDKTVYRFATPIHVVINRTATLPEECSALAWTAATENAAIVDLDSASGEAGTRVTVRGAALGTSLVTVEDATSVRIYTVETVPDTGELEDVTVRVGETHTFTVPEGITVNGIVSGDRMTVSVNQLNDTTYEITGLQDGTVTLTVMAPGVNYTQKVIVHKYDIDKQLTLVLGKTTTSTYSYTFDQIRSIDNKNPDRVRIEQNGNTLTLTPLALATGAKVDVECVVDGLTEPSILHYTIDIVKLDDPELEIWQRPGDDGYIGYKGAAQVFTEAESGDVIMIFTNTTKESSFYVPDAYTAKMDFLAVGGGGGGGTPATAGYGGGGGGAGGFSLVTNRYMMAGTFGISVGDGGLGTTGALHMPTPGFDGGPSVITNAFGYIVASASGGGGGGVPTQSGSTGLSGANGGGGAWYNNNPGQGGRGIDGQGTNGGTPSDARDCGGGGGGAGGKGGSNKAAGLGMSSDISGETVLYAQGGLGGDSESTALAADGTGPGFGGDGGNCGGKGGSGADGVVVIRMSDIYKNVKVPIPTTNDLITARFQWEDGTSCVPFDYYGLTFRSPSNAHLYLWDEAIDRVEGTTNVVCQLLDGTNLVGVGYYSFTVYLKDGFSWDDADADDAYGSTRGRRWLWAVVEDLSNIDAQLSITKSVVWQDSSNATVEVKSSSSPEQSAKKELNVLFLGTFCNGHSLNELTIIKSLNSIAKNASVDWYLLNKPANDNNSGPFTTYDLRGHIDHGYTVGYTLEGGVEHAVTYDASDTKITTSPTVSGTTVTWTKTGGGKVMTMNTNNHQALVPFFETLDAAFASGKTYDYIVMEFDGSRLGDDYCQRAYNGSSITSTKYAQYKNEQGIAEKLLPYYEENSVIWVIDDEGDHGPFTYGGTTPYRPNSYFYNSQNCNLTETQYAGLAALLAPKEYLEWKAGERSHVYTTTMNGTITSGNGTNPVMANSVYSNQTDYANADGLADYLATHIKVKPFNLKYADKIVDPAEGLSITGVTVLGCTNEVNGVASDDPDDWFDIITWDAKTGQSTLGENLPFPGASIEVNLETNFVSAVLSNIAITVWTRFQTHVVDNGTFRSSEGATYNQRTQRWEKNPNDGPVNITMVNNLGDSVGVEGEAETDVPWEYDAYSIHATVVNGEAYIAGLLSNPVSMGEGEDVPVFYLGWGGYKLDKLIVDNNEVTLTEDNANFYTFENLTSAHEIGIEFAPFFSGTESTPATFEYDGQAHVYEVELWDDWDPEFETEVRYSLNQNATGDEFMNKEDFIAYCTSNKLDVVNAGVHSIYYHVFAYQLGWGESIDEYGWVDTEVGGSNTVTITKRPIGITPNPIYLSATNAPETKAELETRQDEFFKGVTAVGLVEGDTLRTEAITFTCPDYQKLVGQYRSFPDLDTKVMSMEEFVGKNYEVTFNPGVVNVIRSPMMVGGVSQAEWLDPENPTHDTGVRRVEKQYDGKPTNLVVRVDLPLDPSAYTIRYSLDDKVTWGPENPTFADVGTNRVWYAVEGTDHGWEGQSLYFAVTNYNYVIITPAPLTIKTASASKTYDGTALTADGYEVTAGALAERDTLASVTMAGSQTDVGSSVNAVAAVSITYKDEWETTWPAEQNYDITYDEGTLTVTRARVVINGVTQSGDPSNPMQWDNCGVEHVVTTYSGQPTNATVKVDRPTPEEGRIIRYTTKKPDETTDGEWLTEMPSFTDAGDHVVYYVIEDSIGNFVPVTNRTYVTIYKVVVTVQAGSDSKVFDGTPLTCPAVDEITGDFVGDDRIVDLAMTSDSTITAVGSVPNKVDPDSVEWSPSDAGRNYELDLLPGTLTVVPASTPFEDQEEDDPFDPENPRAPKSPVDEGGEITALSLLDYVGVYDGEGHTIDTNLLWTAIDSLDWLGSTPAVTYSVDGENWTEDPYVFTNVVATSFWYQVTAPNFSNYVHAAGFVITQRVATVTAASAKWTYDGEEHATNGFTTAGFVTGEGVESVTMTAASKVQNEGDVADNVIESVTYKAGTLESNYAVTLVKGTLKIADPLSFWIADHADAGAGYVNLAIKLDIVGVPELTEELARQYAADFKAVCAATEADLATAEPQSVEFVKFENGFIWVKVQIPTGDSRLLIWKIAYPKQ